MDFAAAVGSSPVARALEVAQFLLQENVCPSCVLRIFNCRPVVVASAKHARDSLHDFRLAQSKLVVAGGPFDGNHKIGSASPGDGHAGCPTCLGILQSLGAEQVQSRTGKAGDGAESSDILPTAAAGRNGGGRGEARDVDTSEREEGLPATGVDLPNFENLAPEVMIRAGGELGAAAREEAELGPGSSLCAAIAARVQEAGHHFDDFALEVALPAIVLVREHALWAHLRGCFPEVDHFQRSCSNAVLPLKDALKDALMQRLEKALGATCEPSSSFRCTLTFSHPDNAAEVEAVVGPAKQPPAKRQKGNYGRWKKGGSPTEGGDTLRQEESPAAVQKALGALSAQEMRKKMPWPLAQVSPCRVGVKCWRSPLFVGGRYLKLVRGISQSPWLVDEERIGKETSVQELLAAGIVQQFRADDYKFSSAGREDIDVRMLGRGRPFVLEILNARVLPPAAAYATMQARINSSSEKWVEVRSLQLVDRPRVDLLREGEAEKQKEYAAVVWLPRPVTEADVEKLNGTRELVIQQRTPIRVLHRRSPLIRPRTIHSMRAELVPGKPHYLLLYLCTQAGTYVKEFVHGDLGRTVPNVGSILGCEADILQLDVTNIKMDFP